MIRFVARLQGHLQVFLWRRPFSPWAVRGLSVPMRALYCMSVYTYLTSILATFTFTLVPILGLWLGWFPVSASSLPP